MKLCDRCYNKDGSVVRSVDTFIMGVEDSRIDVCESCKEEIKQFVLEPDTFKKRKKKDNE